MIILPFCTIAALATNRTTGWKVKGKRKRKRKSNVSKLKYEN